MTYHVVEQGPSCTKHDGVPQQDGQHLSSDDRKPVRFPYYTTIQDNFCAFSDTLDSILKISTVKVILTKVIISTLKKIYLTLKTNYLSFEDKLF